MKKAETTTKTQKTITEYIVQWRWRKEPEKWQSIAPKRHRNLEDAKRELREMKERDLRARRNGKTTDYCGGIGIDIKHYSEYDIIGYRIRRREVTPWETEFEEAVE